MGCLCSAHENSISYANESASVTDVKGKSSLNAVANVSNPEQEIMPLLNAVSPTNIILSDSDTSDVDQEMIRNLLEQVHLSSDDE